jgi:hypothetical protein
MRKNRAIRKQNDQVKPRKLHDTFRTDLIYSCRFRSLTEQGTCRVHGTTYIKNHTRAS